MKPLSEFRASLDSVDPIIDLVRLGTLNRRAISAVGLDVSLVESAAAGCIVLMVGAFEQYLKDIGNKALDHYRLAAPAVRRSQLPEKLQVAIIGANLTAASQARRFGVKRSTADRIRDLDSVANRVADDEVWGEHAIETQSNPSPDTIREILDLCGVDEVWTRLNKEFQRRWQVARNHDSNLKSIPAADNELRSILTWRNMVAHTSTLPNVGFRQLTESSFFFRALAESIDAVLGRHTFGQVSARGSVPAAW